MGSQREVDDCINEKSAVNLSSTVTSLKHTSNLNALVRPEQWDRKFRIHKETVAYGSAFALAFVAHRYIRRKWPRRLPTLTPLGLPAVYMSLAALKCGWLYAAHQYQDSWRDRDLFCLQISLLKAGSPEFSERNAALRRYLRNYPVGEEEHRLLPEAVSELRMSQVDSKENSNVLNERIVDKFFKYESHLWYDTLSKKVWLAYLSMAAEHLDKGSDATSLMKESPKDWDDMSSALACASSHRAGLIRNVALGLGIFATPFAMLARFLGHPTAILSLNGIQRICIFTYIYFSALEPVHTTGVLLRIEDRASFARWLNALFDGNEEVADKVILVTKYMKLKNSS